MWFKRCSVAGIPYHEDGGRMFQLTASGDERSSILMDAFTVSKPVIPVNIFVWVYVDSSYFCHMV